MTVVPLLGDNSISFHCWTENLQLESTAAVGLFGKSLKLFLGTFLQVLFFLEDK